MGLIKAIFERVDILAVIVFMLSTLFVTDGLKRLLRRVTWFCAAMESYMFKLLLSWIVGVLIFAFALPRLFPTIPVDDVTKVQYVFWTILLNGGYELVTWLLKKWRELKELRGL